MVGTVGGDGESDGCVADPSRHLPEARNGRALGPIPSPRAPESRAPPNDGGDDGGDDGGGVGSDDGVVMTVAMKLRDDGVDGGQLR